jgi:hypothetical protein
MFTGLALIALAFFLVLWTADQGARNPLQAIWYLGRHADFGGLAEVTVGVLGVAITVVSIIVELAATRYTPRITEVFLTDRTNQLVLSSYVLVAVTVAWIELSLQGAGPRSEPSALVLGGIVAVSVAVLSLLPYFAYVLDFLSPSRVVQLLSARGRRAVDRLARDGDVDSAWRGVVTAIDQLGDIALKAVRNQDKGISVQASRWLADLLVHHLVTKPELPPKWFDVYERAKRDFDFVAFHRDAVRDLMPRGTWVEMKGLLQFRSLYLAALEELPTAAHFVAIQTRRFGVRCAEEGDEEAAKLTLRFMNSYMRAAINARAVASAYNLFNEYRLLAEGWLKAGKQELVLVVVTRMKDYGLLSFNRSIPFLLETVAYDLCGLLEFAHDVKAPIHDDLLEVFLDVDREPTDEGAETQESALRGVRKAQVKLATYYLARGEADLARRIHEDMVGESPLRLRGIREELERTVDPTWWEISDRGTNFDYLEPGRRAQLAVFFAWFEHGDS